MATFQVGGHLAAHPAALRVSLDALGFWTLAGAWCARHSLDGSVPAEVIRSLRGTPELAEELIKAGLWRRRRKGSYQFIAAVPAARNCPPLPIAGWDRGERRRSIPDRVRAAVFARDNHQCVWCRSTEDLCLDHIYPWSKGGLDTVQNLQLLCRPCNSSKGARI